MENKIEISWESLETVRQIVHMAKSNLQYANGTTPVVIDLSRADEILYKALYVEDDQEDGR